MYLIFLFYVRSTQAHLYAALSRISHVSSFLFETQYVAVLFLHYVCANILIIPD